LVDVVLVEVVVEGCEGVLVLVELGGLDELETTLVELVDDALWEDGALVLVVVVDELELEELELADGLPTWTPNPTIVPWA